jgi:hypothetical protein
MFWVDSKLRARFNKLRPLRRCSARPRFNGAQMLAGYKEESLKGDAS